jgi:Glucosidase II beta subunit-like protein
VMAAIGSTCLMKTEEWWSYEVCFNKGVRQFHIQLEVHPDEKTGEVKHFKVSG